MKATNPTVRATRRYLIQMCVAMLLYVLVIHWTRLEFRDARGASEVAAALAPLVPLLLVFAAGLRLFLSTDEFTRRIMTDSLAIAGIVTALLAATYGFLQGDPLPNPSAWWTWTTFMASWLVATFVLKARYR
jgi:hypothetical protein